MNTLQYTKLNVKYENKNVTYRIPTYFIYDIYRYVFLSKSEFKNVMELEKETKKELIDYINLVIKDKYFGMYDSISYGINEVIHKDIIKHSTTYHKQKSLI